MPQHSWRVGGGCTTRLYQWLSRRASFFRSEKFGSGATRTVRTEVTVERQALTVLVRDLAVDFDTCPLCGNKLTSVHAEHARSALPQGSNLQGPVSVDRPPHDLVLPRDDPSWGAARNRNRRDEGRQ